jgi:hypothetical protein
VDGEDASVKPDVVVTVIGTVAVAIVSYSYTFEAERLDV